MKEFLGEGIGGGTEGRIDRKRYKTDPLCVNHCLSAHLSVPDHCSLCPVLFFFPFLTVSLCNLTLSHVHECCKDEAPATGEPPCICHVICVQQMQSNQGCRHPWPVVSAIGGVGCLCQQLPWVSVSAPTMRLRTVCVPRTSWGEQSGLQVALVARTGLDWAPVDIRKNPSSLS